LIKIIALSSPANCHEQIVTPSEFTDLPVERCVIGAPRVRRIFGFDNYDDDMAMIEAI
jgi:hypothetical protein